MPTQLLFHCYFTTHHFVGWGASYQGISGKHLLALRASAGRFAIVGDDTLFKTLHETTFPTFTILKQQCFTFTAKYLNGLCWAFLIWFCHLSHCIKAELKLIYSLHASGSGSPVYWTQIELVS